MSGIILFLLALAVFIVVAILIDRKPRRIMQEGDLLENKIVYRDREKLYVEKVVFKDWHVSIHSYYLISDRLAEGQTIVEQ